MKIIHISTADRSGGAPIATYRLNEAMNATDGIESKMLVMNKTSSSDKVVNLSGRYSTFKKLFTRLYSIIIPALQYRTLKPSGVFSISSGVHHPSTSCLVKEADIIYIHWCNGGYINLKEIRRILRLGKPTYIFLHDMWLLTGGCHHSLDCKGFLADCRSCPFVGSRLAQLMVKRQQNLKRFSADFDNLTLLSPSSWMDNQIAISRNFKNVRHHVTYNPLPLNIFRPIDTAIARQILNLPEDKRLILFVADGGTSNPYKGWRHLKEALISLNQDQSTELIVIGNNLNDTESREIGLEAHSFGRIHDELALAIFYSAADLFVVSSLADNAPQVVVEAQACGCPVTGFMTGGIPDMMIPAERSNLVNPKDSQALAKKIIEILKRTNSETDKMSRHNHIAAKFGEKSVVDTHIQLWNRKE